MGLIETYGQPADLDHPIYNIILKNNFDRNDYNIPHSFYVTLSCDDVSIKKHIVLKE
jgi:hypothetical protein